MNAGNRNNSLQEQGHVVQINQEEVGNFINEDEMGKFKLSLKLGKGAHLWHLVRYDKVHETTINAAFIAS